MPIKIIFDEKQKEEIIKLYNSGLSCKNIGKQFNCSKQVINCLLKKNKISFRDASHSNRTYNIDENIFDNIDTKEKAYWLGMLTGDGWIDEKGGFGFSLEENDKKYIYAFRDFIKSNHPINRISNGFKKDGTESISYDIRITNKKIFLDLQKYGFTHNKTHYIKFTKINDKYLSNYILGLIDSDGSFCIKTHYKRKHIKLLNFNFIGPNEFVETLQLILINKCKISKTKLGKSKNTNFVKTIEYGGYKNIFKIVKYLYNDPPEIWMERKKKIAIDYLLTKYPNDQWLINQSQNTPFSEMS